MVKIKKMWVCKKCGRSFKNKNQVHGCHQISLESLLIKRNVHIRSLYHNFHERIPLTEYRREAVPPDVIFYKSISTFLAVKLKTKWIDIEFFLDYDLDHPVIKKSLQTSKHRYVYVVSIDEEADITNELMSWINYSYDLITS